MQLVNKILAFIDSSLDSVMTFDRAVDLAESTGAAVTAMDVVPRQRRGQRSKRSGLSAETHRHLLEDLANHFGRQRVPIDVAIRQGKPSVELVRTVIEGDFDLVIKAALGRGGDRGSLFGTTAMQLIRKCPCPVWLLGSKPLPPRPKVRYRPDPRSLKDPEPS